MIKKCEDAGVKYLNDPVTIDTTLPASDPLRFRKKMFHPYKNDINWSD